MQNTGNQLEHLPVREIITYEYDDMMAYVGITALLSMGTVLLLILSL